MIPIKKICTILKDLTDLLKERQVQTNMATLDRVKPMGLSKRIKSSNDLILLGRDVFIIV